MSRIAVLSECDIDFASPALIKACETGRRLKEAAVNVQKVDAGCRTATIQLDTFN